MAGSMCIVGKLLLVRNVFTLSAYVSCVYYDHRSSFISLCEYCIACCKFLSYLLHNIGHSFVLYIGEAFSMDDLLQFLAARNRYGSYSLTSKSLMALSVSVTKVGMYESVGFSILYFGP